MNDTEKRLPWSRWPRPASAKLVWTARAIHRPDSRRPLDLLHDRQNIDGCEDDPDARKAFIEAMNAYLPDYQRAVGEGIGDDFTVYVDDKPVLFFKGEPSGCGYYYAMAWTEE